VALTFALSSPRSHARTAGTLEDCRITPCGEWSCAVSSACPGPLCSLSAPLCRAPWRILERRTKLASRISTLRGCQQTRTVRSTKRELTGRTLARFWTVLVTWETANCAKPGADSTLSAGFQSWLGPCPGVARPHVGHSEPQNHHETTTFSPLQHHWFRHDFLAPHGGLRNGHRRPFRPLRLQRSSRPGTSANCTYLHRAPASYRRRGSLLALPSDRRVCPG
jgi:hypothetical protein